MSSLTPTPNVRVWPIAVSRVGFRHLKARYSTSCARSHDYSTAVVMAVVMAVDGARVFARREPPQRLVGHMPAS